MNRSFTKVVFSLLSLASVLNAGGVSLGGDVLDELYGAGVHAYFAGNTEKSQELLNDVINAGSNDPRAYFFRGLALAKSQGDLQAGMADFEEGARLEVQRNRGREVSDSLQRIQGPMRLAIEKARKNARLSITAARFEEIKKRYGDNPAAAAAALEAERSTPKPSTASATPYEANASTADAATPMPADSPAPPAAADPFGSDSDAPASAGDDAPMSDPADSADPFGGSETEAPADSSDPFGS
jgi:hypothetical protein